MKKLVIAGMLLAGVAGFAGANCLLNGNICQDESGNTTIQGRVTNSAGEGIPSLTLAQINTTAPKQAGQAAYCSNCVNSTVCVSSGTGIGAYVSSSSPIVHCDVR
jgi:hypothetical protein